MSVVSTHVLSTVGTCSAPMTASRSTVDHVIRLVPVPSHVRNPTPRATERMMRGYNGEIDNYMTDSERRIYAVIVRTIRNSCGAVKATDLFLHHVFPGMWALKRAVSLSKSLRCGDVVPFVLSQPGIMQRTVFLLGGENKLDALIESESTSQVYGEWNSQPLPEVVSGTPHSNQFPNANEVMRTHGDALLHTLGYDLNHFVRLYAELQVVMSNLHAKRPFVQHHNLMVTAGSQYVSPEGLSTRPATYQLEQWLTNASSLIQMIPLPLCVHPERGTRLNQSAGLRAGKTSLWHVSKCARGPLSSLGVPIPSAAPKVPCEGCGDACSGHQ